MWWDERRAGGRVHGWLFLFHPGPSLLVTATFVAVSALAARAAPSALHALHLAGAMLPIQFAIGAANDVVDRGGDAATEPYKPLVRGAMSVPSATAAAVVLATAGLASAATINPLTGALCGLGLAAGLSYDLGLRRTVLSVVPWWAGFALLPLAAFAAAGVTTARLLWLLPLTALVALGLHLANGAPDVEGDRRVGRRSLPARLGERWSRRLASVSLLGVLALGIGSAAASGRLNNWVEIGGIALAAAILPPIRFAMERPFPLLATGVAAFAAAWLASVAVP